MGGAIPGKLLARPLLPTSPLSGHASLKRCSKRSRAGLPPCTLRLSQTGGGARREREGRGKVLTFRAAREKKGEKGEP